MTWQLVLVIAAALGFFLLFPRHGPLVERAATVGGKYWVQDLPDATAAANELARLELIADKLCAYIDAHPELDDGFKRLRSRWARGRLEESVSQADHTSFSENKGQRIVVCIRSKDAGLKIIDPNTITFVFLHELGHLMTEATGHGTEFWSAFKRLLTVAVAQGIYRKVDYETNPMPYCGIVITDNPLNRPDDQLPTA